MTDHDIDLSAAIEAADYALRADNNAADNDSLDESWNREAEIAVEAALPHILAQVEARVKPSREEIAHTWFREQARQAAIVCGLERPVTWDACTPEDHERMFNSADAVLSLLPGRTEQEVREQIAAEMEAAANSRDYGADSRFANDEAQANRAGKLNGLDLAARIARQGVL